jgi:hypothetical protein
MAAASAGRAKPLGGVKRPREPPAPPYVTPEQFSEAVTNGDVRLVKRGLAQTGAAAVPLRTEKNALFVKACELGHTSVARLLAGITGPRRVALSKVGVAAASAAANGGHAETLAYLVRPSGPSSVRKKRSWQKEFTAAYDRRDIPVMRVFLRLKDIQPLKFPQTSRCTPPLWEACVAGDANMASFLLELPASYKVLNQYMTVDKILVKVASAGFLNVAKVLLGVHGRRRVWRDGANQAFAHACTNGHTLMAKTILELAGDRVINVQSCDNRAIRWACAKGHLSTVQMLLELPPHQRVNVTVFNNAPFYDACRYGHPAVARILLGLGGDDRVNVHDRDPFGEACLAGHTEVVQLLMQLRGDRMYSQNTLQNGARRALLNKHYDVVEAVLRDTQRRGFSDEWLASMLSQRSCTPASGVGHMLLSVQNETWKEPTRSLIRCVLEANTGCSTAEQTAAVAWVMHARTVDGGRLTGASTSMSIREWLTLFPTCTQALRALDAVEEGEAVLPWQRRLPAAMSREMLRA